MRRLIPGTITGRAICALLIGLIVSHAISILIYASDRHHSLASIDDHWAAGQIATVARLFASVPIGHRGDLIAASNTAALQVWTSVMPFVEQSTEDALGQDILQKLRLTLNLPEPPNIAVVIAPRSAITQGDTFPLGPISRLFEGPREQVLQASIRSDEVTWLNFVVPLSSPSPWSDKFLVSAFLMALVVFPVLVWVLRLVTRPFTAFASAAERIGMNLDTPPLPEKGPREVMQASRALNEMQKRIRALVENRTGVFAAISHDLRTPITRLRLRAEFIDDAEQKSKMMRDLDEMDAMIATTLSFARDDAATEPVRLVDVGALVLSVCDDLKDLGKHVEIENVKRIVLLVRPIALRRALTNVIDNATQYGQGAQIGVSDDAKRVEIDVSDSGPGIPEDELERVFQPFYRLERSRGRNTGGIGLGLSVARTIARAHGGDLVLENRDEGGLSARFFLPKSMVDKRGEDAGRGDWHAPAAGPVVVPFLGARGRP